MKARIIALAAVLLIVAALVIWTGRRLYARQPEQNGESRSFTVSFPVGWAPISMANDSGDTAYVGFTGQDAVAGAFSMTLRDEGKAVEERSVAENIVRQNKARDAEIIALPNGLKPKTWEQLTPGGELNWWTRWFVFTGPNGHVYSATYDLSRSWLSRRRQDVLARRILGSLRFK